MDLIQAIILGLIQGLTEFIPVSSSGHLVLVPWLLGWEKPPLVFDTTLHWGTLLAVGTYFWRDLLAIARGMLSDSLASSPDAKLGWLLVLATIPAVLVGVLFESQFEALFGEPVWVAGFLLITGLLLWGSESLGTRLRELGTLDWSDGALIGLAQALAITPGISRSGATISMGLVRGLTRPAAARFSFLMMIPIVFGAGLVQLIELLQEGTTAAALTPMVVGFAAAAISGYAAIAFLLDFLARRSVRLFAVYCWVFGLFCLLFALLT